MKAFRIGRKPVGSWTSMTPPIRGGVYRKLDEPASEDGREEEKILAAEGSVESDADSFADSSAVSESGSDSSKTRDSDLDDLAASSLSDRGDAVSSATSDCSSSVVSKDEVIDGAVRRRRFRSASVAGVGVDADEPHADDDVFRRLSPTEYTDWAMQQEISQDLRGYPSVDPAVQQDITRKYQAMHQKVKDLGYYDCPYVEYGKECARYLSLFTAFAVLLHYEWYLPSAFFLGLFWVRSSRLQASKQAENHFLCLCCPFDTAGPMLTQSQHQIMFTAHDAGHRAITHHFVTDTLIGLFIADFCCGLSIGWWKSSHNVHHLVTNQPEHDPDIQNVPLFATCPSFFKSLVSSYYNFTFYWDKAAEVLVPYQKYTYYPVMGIARFNLYLLSWIHVLSKRSTGLSGSSAWWIRPTEITFMACYWFLFGYCLLLQTLPTWPIRVGFVFISHMTLMPLHVQITLSHWGMSTTDLGESESFAQRQLRTTMDVDCPRWMDFVHGGLQFQVIHHLFPRVPRHNLRKVQALVRDFCRDTGIPYSILSFVDGNKKVIGRLDQVGEQVAMLVNCQKYMAETGESGLH